MNYEYILLSNKREFCLLLALIMGSNSSLKFYLWFISSYDFLKPFWSFLFDMISRNICRSFTPSKSFSISRTGNCWTTAKLWSNCASLSSRKASIYGLSLRNAQIEQKRNADFRSKDLHSSSVHKGI